MQEKNYDDIINLPRHISATRKRMTNYERAAQFSAFAALTGYDSLVHEKGRETDAKEELTDYKIAKLEERLQILQEKAKELPYITITFFKPDERKKGGEYVIYSGNFRRIDESDSTIILSDGRKILIENIYEIESEAFEELKELYE